MPESGLSGSVRGVPSNGHPYRDPAAHATAPGGRRHRAGPKPTAAGEGPSIAPRRSGLVRCFGAPAGRICGSRQRRLGMHAPCALTCGRFAIWWRIAVAEGRLPYRQAVALRRGAGGDETGANVGKIIMCARCVIDAVLAATMHSPFEAAELSAEARTVDQFNKATVQPRQRSSIQLGLCQRAGLISYTMFRKLLAWPCACSAGHQARHQPAERLLSAPGPGHGLRHHGGADDQQGTGIARDVPAVARGRHDQVAACVGAAAGERYCAPWAWGPRLTISMRRFSGAFTSILFFGLVLP
jgi:hypothetical protein